MKNKFLFVALIAVIALAGLSLIRGNKPPPRPGNMIAQGVADVAADEIAKRLGANVPIVVIQGSGSLSDSEMATRLPDQLTAALAKRGITQIVDRQKVITFGADLSELPEGTPIPETARNPTPQLPWDVLAGVLRNHPDVSAVVSLIGPPRVTSQDAALWKKVGPKIFVVMAAGDPTPSKIPLQQGVLDLAILPRLHGEPVGAKLPNSPRAWFDSQYQVLTPETVGEMK